MTSKAKDRFPNYESICLQCGATIYKPYRELTEDEIREVLVEEGIYVKLKDGGFAAFQEDADLHKFARAILKKASEK